MLVADNIRITNKTIETAVSRFDPAAIQDMAKRCEAAGAEAIDINSGPLTREPEKKMEFLVEAIQAVSSLPIIIDTTNPKAIEAGLRVKKNRAIINGFSLEPSKLDFILPLAKKYEAEIIGYLLYPNSHVPPDSTERLNIAVELYKKYKNAGLEDERLIIDPIVAPLIWQDGNFQDREILYAIRALPDLLGFDVRTIGGLSNLTAGKGDRQRKLLMERVYLPMLLESGLSMVLMDMFHTETIQVARACKPILSKKVFSWEDVL
ncbi:Dihydropteroate synthase DHPS [uncultured Desulfobacterium sp.]|uniref:Dihydropteroate synthase DHPS n=1 Tax=uncultured Desulfobacterium sp. TaxID=201089 RepID=A0A445MS76_9BACT|nr:Dihydropteroate synthase DHPS [uncultured Desulfobacterium sp.]